MANGKMKKIYVNKTDSAASIIERVISVEDREVTLYIPRDTEFSRLKNNFRLLKREAGQAGKEITIESVEDITLESAAALGIKSVNPFFGQKARMVSDIVMKTEVDGPTTQSHRQNVKQPEVQARKEPSKADTIFTAREFGDESGSVWTDEEERPHSRKLTFALIFSAIVLIGAGTALYFILPQATIALTFTETPFAYNGQLIVDSNAQSASASGTQITIPGTLFSDTENNVVAFTPSGSSQVSHKAVGTIQIYNAYSSRPQSLVATTRFTAPNGKVYRLDKGVTVPGATMSNGQLVPASIQANVTADQPGVDYNISTTTRFRIPGFQNTPKYNGFYADSVGPFTGGFVGVMSVPTASDLTSARANAQDTLNQALEAKLILKMPPNENFVTSSARIAVTSEDISSSPNSQGQYTITEYGQIEMFGFKESDVLFALAVEVQSGQSDHLYLHDYSANYSNAQPDFKNGTMSVSLNFSSNWVQPAQPFDVSNFQTRAEGLDDSALKTLIFSLPGIKTADVKFWPFWVRGVPQNTSKIHVDVVYSP